MIKLIKLSVLTVVLSLPLFSWSQQDPQYTQYTYAMGLVNPAYVATTEAFSVTTLGRTQWVGVEGAPRTMTLTAGLPVGEKVGTALSFIRDEIGPATESIIFGDFSYDVQLNDNVKLGLGLRAGVSFLDVNELNFSDDNFDPLDVPVSLTSPTVGFGAFLYGEKFFFGLSVPNFLESEHLERNGNFVSASSEALHIFGTFGYVFDINKNMRLKPSTMVKYGDGGNYSIDLSANLLIDNQFEFGLSHRLDGTEFLSESISALFAFNVAKEFRIGYAFDYSLASFQDFNSGTHEIMISYTFKNNTKFSSPRFF